MVDFIEFNTVISQIKNKIDIYDVISSYFPLKQSGNYYKALCPFHDEKTPSFYVSQKNQTYHCFGCNKGGDIFTFIMEKENISFYEATKLLAIKANITLNIDKYQKNNKIIEKKLKIYKLYTIISNWYSDNLLNKDIGKPILSYLENRKISKRMIELFQIGFAPNAWNATIEYAKLKKFNNEEIFSAGLCFYNKTTNKIFDAYKNRLIFPICNETGDIIAFSARILAINKDEDKERKYINTSETFIFKKQNILYGLYFAKEGIKKRGFAILCEGQLDVISMFQIEYTNTVASQGTSFTRNQAKLLKRFTNCVYICFDGDNAGIKATQNAIDILLELEFSIKIIQLSNMQDPNSLCQNNNITVIHNSVKNAIDFFQYIFNNYINIFNINDPFEKNKIIKNMFTIIKKIKNIIIQSHYISLLANKLQLSHQILYNEFKKTFSNQEKVKTDNKNEIKLSISRTNMLNRMPEEQLLYFVINNQEVANIVSKQLKIKYINSNYIGNTLKNIINLNLTNKWNNIKNYLSEQLKLNYNPIMSELLLMDITIHKEFNIKKMIADCIKNLKIKYIQNKIDKIKVKLKQNNTVTNKYIILKQIIRLSRLIKKL